jgi:hypothetical protein
MFMVTSLWKGRSRLFRCTEKTARSSLPPAATICKQLHSVGKERGMTGPEYIQLRKTFLEAASWFILSSDRAKKSPKDLDEIVQKVVVRLGEDLRKEVERELSDKTLHLQSV